MCATASPGCNGVATTATLALLLALRTSDYTLLAMYFAAVSGMSLGLPSPLNGLCEAEVFGDARLGTLSGVRVVVSSLATAAGAWLAGIAIEVTGSYREMLAAAILLQLLAVAALLWQRAPLDTG